MDVGDLECDGLSDRGQVRAVNDEQFVIAELRKSMVVHRSSGALGEPSPHIRRRPPPIGQSGESRAPTLGGFTEGFATADLQEAQALLGELS
jgi:hypothetical protein